MNTDNRNVVMLTIMYEELQKLKKKMKNQEKIIYELTVLMSAEEIMKATTKGEIESMYGELDMLMSLLNKKT